MKTPFIYLSYLARRLYFITPLFLIPIFLNGQAPMTTTFTSSGNFVILPGSGYHSNITVYVWGAGGAGGTKVGTGDLNESAGGGGGGYVIRSFTGVGAGTYPVVVGTGGTTAGIAGGLSSFAGPEGITLTAGGGGSSITRTGATGGTANGGTTNEPGGNGGGTVVESGGGGGGGSGPVVSNNGANGTTGSGVAAGGLGGSLNIGVSGTGTGNGGVGGSRDASPTAFPGISPGGGGGGRGTGDVNGTSKAGADGRVIVVVTQLLSIQLSSFEIIASKNPVLRWTTVAEWNNDYFSVEHSQDGINYTEITKVNEQESSDKPTVYSYTDHTPYSGINYYRLRQVDIDGSYTTYPTKSVFVPVDDILVFPTLFDHEVTLQLSPPYDKAVNWALYDVLGNNIKTGKILNSQAMQKLSLNGLQSGSVYILAVFTDLGIGTKKLIRL